MARSKRHHYIPQSFQNRFCRPDGKLWYAQRVDAQKFSLYERTPFGCFWSSNLNTTMVDGKPSDELEREFWGNVDNTMADFVRWVDDSFSMSIPPKLLGQDLRYFGLFFALIARRSPDATELPNADEVGEQYQTQIKKMMQEMGHEAKPKYDDKNWLRQIGRDILARAKAEYPTLVVEALGNYSVRWAIPEKRASFILGSKNVYRAYNGGSGHLEDPRTELFWPLSPKLALVMLQIPDRSFPMVVPARTEMVREWNLSICAGSSAIGSHSEKLMRSLLGSKLDGGRK